MKLEIPRYKEKKFFAIILQDDRFHGPYMDKCFVLKKEAEAYLAIKYSQHVNSINLWRETIEKFDYKKILIVATKSDYDVTTYRKYHIKEYVIQL